MSGREPLTQLVTGEPYVMWPVLELLALQRASAPRFRNRTAISRVTYETARQSLRFSTGTGQTNERCTK